MNKFSEKKNRLSKISVSQKDGSAFPYGRVLVGKKCSVFGEFGVLCFLVTAVLKFALLPYHRQYVQCSTEPPERKLLLKEINIIYITQLIVLISKYLLITSHATTSISM